MSGPVVCVLVTMVMVAFAAPRREPSTSSKKAEVSFNLYQENQGPHRIRHHQPKGSKKYEKTAPKPSNVKPGPKHKDNRRALHHVATRTGGIVDVSEPLSRMSSLHPQFWANKYFYNRTLEPDWNKESDCLFGSRKIMKRYPEDPGNICYLYDFEPRKDVWWNFWPEIRGDLQFAFDFVMWDEYEPYHETNTLWYLMLYLRILKLNIRNPNYVATRNLQPDTRRRSVNESLRCAPDPNKPEQFSDDSLDLLHDLLTQYKNKIEQLSSLVARL